MPYLRLTADRRGVEHTFLLHVPVPGAPPKVLYWYRTAPGLRLGRPALDDAAMRAIEEQYPDIDFDWPYILDMGAMTPVEVEAPLPARKRRTRPDEDEGADSVGAPPAVVAGPEEESPGVESSPAAAAALPAAPDLLAELLGRGIAASLRARFAELRAAVDASPADPALIAAWRSRLLPLDPDGWGTPEAVLAGMSTVESMSEALRHDVQTHASA